MASTKSRPIYRTDYDFMRLTDIMIFKLIELIFSFIRPNICFISQTSTGPDKKESVMTETLLDNPEPRIT